jgi:hypothetical protein
MAALTIHHIVAKIIICLSAKATTLMPRPKCQEIVKIPLLTRQPDARFEAYVFDNVRVFGEESGPDAIFSPVSP